MTTIFEGTVNGKKFDNIKEYEVALNEVKNKGLGYTASCEYKTSSEKTEPDKISETSKPTSNKLPMPGFGDGQDIVGYFDDITNSETSQETIDFKIQDMHEYLDNCWKTIDSTIDNTSAADIKSYVSDLEDVVSIIKGYWNTNKDTIKSKYNNLEVLNKIRNDYENKLNETNISISETIRSIDKLNLVKEEIAAFQVFYEDCLKFMKDHIDVQAETEDDVLSTTASDLQKKVDELKNNNTIDTKKDSLRDLLESIFGEFESFLK